MKNNQFFKSLTIICVFCLFTNINSYAAENDQIAKLPETNLPLCLQLPNGKLNIRESCYIDILAKEPENAVGIIIKKGQEYSFTVKGNQFWYDLDRKNEPLCGESGSWLMNSFLLFKDKKSKNSLWFSVIAEVKNENKLYDLCSKDKKTTGSLIATGSGMLIMYANDVEGYYDNNRGKIRVEILRIK